jgi:hypothetical protein
MRLVCELERELGCAMTTGFASRGFIGSGILAAGSL